MGFWKTKNKVVIGDEYADELESWADKGWKKIKKAYPDITQKQFVETVKFILGRFEEE